MERLERKPIDWWEWHQEYDAAGSPLQLRTEVVHRHIRAVLDSHRAGTTFRVVSACAGQGRELLPVLAAHPRRADVRARLIELDPRNVAAASDAVSELKLDWNVEIVCGDASRTDAYAGAVPADLVVLCGIFGLITAEDARNTIELLPHLCTAGAAVVWTRQRRATDLTPEIRGWFEQAGFREDAFESPAPDASWVGLQRFSGESRPFTPGLRLFAFPTSFEQEGSPR
jgi:hypothetical protein